MLKPLPFKTGLQRHDISTTKNLLGTTQKIYEQKKIQKKEQGTIKMNNDILLNIET